MFGMKQTVGSVVGLVGVACPGALVMGADMEPQIHAGLSAPVLAWRKAMESGDLVALARMHGPQTTGFPPDQRTRVGSDAIMKDYAGLFAKYTARVSFDEAHWVEAPPLVVSWGLYTLTLQPKGGGPDVVTRGRFTDAATRTGAGWRYIVDHASIPSGK